MLWINGNNKTKTTTDSVCKNTHFLLKSTYFKKKHLYIILFKIYLQHTLRVNGVHSWYYCDKTLRTVQSASLLCWLSQYRLTNVLLFGKEHWDFGFHSAWLSRHCPKKKAMDLIRNIPCTKYCPRHVRRTQLFTQTTNLFSLYVFLYFVNTTDFYWDDFVLALKISQLTKCTRSAKCTLSASVKCF